MLPLAHSQAEDFGSQRPFVVGIIPVIDGHSAGGLGGGGFGGGGGRAIGGGSGGGFGGGGFAGGASATPEAMAALEAAAKGVEVGETFRYDIDAPVSVPKQQSAMLPIVNQDVPAEKLSIYNSKANEEHPLHGVQLTNDTGLHLVAGPITVFEAGEYGGDAQIGHVRPDEKRLISYALDAETKVNKASTAASRRLVGASIVCGELQTKYANDSQTSYLAKNSSAAAKTLLIEHPRTTGWTLVEPAEPVEQAEDVLRFRVAIAPKDNGQLTVSEQQPATETIKLDSAPRADIIAVLESKVASENVRLALRKMLDLQEQLAQFVQRRAQTVSNVSDINREQERIRKNMETLDRNSELYRTYVKKLSEQEMELERLPARFLDIDTQEAQTKKQLDELTTLNLE
jgi:hypothetical protein